MPGALIPNLEDGGCLLEGGTYLIFPKLWAEDLQYSNIEAWELGNDEMRLSINVTT